MWLPPLDKDENLHALGMGGQAGQCEGRRVAGRSSIASPGSATHVLPYSEIQSFLPRWENLLTLSLICGWEPKIETCQSLFLCLLPSECLYFLCSVLGLVPQWLPYPMAPACARPLPTPCVKYPIWLRKKPPCLVFLLPRSTFLSILRVSAAPPIHTDPTLGSYLVHHFLSPFF